VNDASGFSSASATGEMLPFLVPFIGIAAAKLTHGASASESSTVILGLIFDILLTGAGADAVALKSTSSKALIGPLQTFVMNSVPKRIFNLVDILKLSIKNEHQRMYLMFPSSSGESQQSFIIVWTVSLSILSPRVHTFIKTCSFLGITILVYHWQGACGAIDLLACSHHYICRRI
jgi:hypothetical protein